MPFGKSAPSKARKPRPTAVSDPPKKSTTRFSIFSRKNSVISDAEKKNLISRPIIEKSDPQFPSGSRELALQQSLKYEKSLNQVACEKTVKSLYTSTLDDFELNINHPTAPTISSIHSSVFQTESDRNRHYLFRLSGVSSISSGILDNPTLNSTFSEELSLDSPGFGVAPEISLLPDSPTFFSPQRRRGSSLGRKSVKRGASVPTGQVLDDMVLVGPLTPSSQRSSSAARARDEATETLIGSSDTDNDAKTGNPYTGSQPRKSKDSSDESTMKKNTLPSKIVQQQRQQLQQQYLSQKAQTFKRQDNPYSRYQSHEHLQQKHKLQQLDKRYQSHETLDKQKMHQNASTLNVNRQHSFKSKPNAHNAVMKSQSLNRGMNPENRIGPGK